ncbi:MAG: hypothetical protein CMK09_18220 [Ponticaulis sp.]|nr:hypothetical protein [Ponticaulis sp.]
MSGTEPLSEALKLVCDQGLGGLTVRALAGQIDTSPSTVMYRFKSRDGLVLALLGELVEVVAEQNLESLEMGVPDQMTRDKLLVMSRARLIDQVISRRAHYLGLWEIELQTVLPEDQKSLLLKWREQDVQFWEAYFAAAGVDPKLADVWSAGFIAIQRLLLIAAPNAVRLAWMDDALTRLFERLTGQAPSCRDDSHGRIQSEIQLSELGDVADDESSTPHRIVAAASEQILTYGCDGISHRSIASRAGVSLSSMTHHFATLEDILCAAFHMIYRDASIRAQYLPKSRAYSKREFIDDVLPELSRQNSGGQATAHAMESIILKASRRADMTSTSVGLFALMGATTTQILSALTDAGPFDRLDGHVFRMVLTGTRLFSETLAADDPLNPTNRFLEAYL